jgi:hypothetical protein
MTITSQTHTRHARFRPIRFGLIAAAADAGELIQTEYDPPHAAPLASLGDCAVSDALGIIYPRVCTFECYLWNGIT